MITDRKLGDEWIEWDGDLSRYETRVDSGKRVFLGFAVLSIFLLALFIALFWYLIEPRMIQISRTLAAMMQTGVLVTIAILFIVLILTVMSIIVNKNLLIGIGRRKFDITFLTPLIFKLGEKFGFSYDRMGNSFIRVSNSLIRTTHRRIAHSRILILLPRCLKKSLQNSINTLAQKYNCLVFTVPGGELARKIIAREKPLAVIGIACERDLVSGIRDVHRIPVIGIPNQRPEGPCKNTLVDFNKIEEAIQYFLNDRMN